MQNDKNIIGFSMGAKKEFMQSKITMVIIAIWGLFALFPQWDYSDVLRNVGRFFIFTPPYLSSFHGAGLTLRGTGVPCVLNSSQFLAENSLFALIFFFNYLFWNFRKKGSHS